MKTAGSTLPCVVALINFSNIIIIIMFYVSIIVLYLMSFYLLFKVRAFHIQWAQLPLDNNIKKWSVHILSLDQNRRHLDRAKLQEFWESLDRYVDNHLKIYRVPTAQGKQKMAKTIFVRENTGNLEKLPKHREFWLLML